MLLKGGEYDLADKALNIYAFLQELYEEVKEARAIAVKELHNG